MQPRIHPAFRAAAALCLGAAAAVGAATATVAPTADAFVRSLAPDANYGAAGSLSVSGAAALNGAGQQSGRLDSLLRFPTAGAVEGFDSELGSNQWLVVGARLRVTEVAAPNNPVFNRGVGAFEIRWLAPGRWTEGTGTPNLPTADGVTWQDLPALLDPQTDVPLGRFTNNGANGPLSFPLALPAPLLAELAGGGELNLYLTAAEPSVGFTFNSRNFTSAGSWPALELTAEPRPSPRITSIEHVGGGHVALRFNTPSNWTCLLQGLSGPPGGAAGAWSNLAAFPAGAADAQAAFVDEAVAGWKLYRLVLCR
jgi:hypothetical protein